MVANAGIVKLGPLLDSTLFSYCLNLVRGLVLLTLPRVVPSSDLDKHYAVNIKGMFHSYRAAARVMVPAGYGRIIGACSTAAKLSMWSPVSVGLSALILLKMISTSGMGGLLHE